MATYQYREKAIELRRYAHGWRMFVDGQPIGTSSRKERAEAYARAYVDLRIHEAIHGKPTEEEIFGRL
jgi:hypothetical protein